MTEKQRQERERKRLEIAYKENGLNNKGLPSEKNPVERYTIAEEEEDGEKVERVQSEEVTAQEIINQIEDLKETFENENNISNWRKESPSLWSAFCLRCGSEVFGNGKKNLLKEIQTPQETNTEKRARTGLYGRYDIEKIETIYNYYKYLCGLLDVPVRVYDFAQLTGMTRQVIYEKSYNLTSSIRDFYQKISADNEQSLENIAIGGKRSTVGVLATLNHRHGWDKSQNVRQEDTTNTIKAVELPRLGQNSQE